LEIAISYYFLFVRCRKFDAYTINFVHYLQSKDFPGFGQGDPVLEFDLSPTSTVELVGEDAEVDS